MPEPQTPDLPENQLAPFHMFRFQVSFTRANLPGAQAKPTSDVPLCSGAFAECTGIEATMEPKVIKVGGSNYGPAQRVGPVSTAERAHFGGELRGTTLDHAAAPRPASARPRCPIPDGFGREIATP